MLVWKILTWSIWGGGGGGGNLLVVFFNQSGLIQDDLLAKGVFHCFSIKRTQDSSKLGNNKQFESNKQQTNLLVVFFNQSGLIQDDLLAKECSTVLA